jgi:hypothetical protein
VYVTVAQAWYYKRASGVNLVEELREKKDIRQE